LSQALQTRAPIEVTGASTTLFGKKQEVTLVEPQQELWDLHNLVLSIVESSKGQLTSAKYTGSHFMAHVTKKGSRHLEPREQFILNKLHIIEANANENPRTRQKRIVETLTLNGKNYHG